MLCIYLRRCQGKSHLEPMDRGVLENEVASERDALLSPTTDRATDDGDDIAGHDMPTTLKGSTLRIAAAGFDFWITGVAVAALGVCMHSVV